MQYAENKMIKRQKNNKRIKSILWIVFILLLYHIILVMIPYISETETNGIFGYKAYVIISDSMKPYINSGDIVIVKKYEEEKIKKGDVITFEKNQETITHRIIEINENEGIKEYSTKGDNNRLEDLETVKYEEIKGVKVITVPWIGKIIIALENKIIFLITIWIILIISLIKMEIEDKKEERRAKKRIEDEKFKWQEQNKKSE